jgi:hypothetical protein
MYRQLLFLVALLSTFVAGQNSFAQSIGATGAKGNAGFPVASDNLRMSSNLLKIVLRDRAEHETEVSELKEMVVRNLVYLRASAPDVSSMSASELETLCAIAQDFDELQLSTVREGQLVPMLRTYISELRPAVESRIGRLQDKLMGTGCTIGGAGAGK